MKRTGENQQQPDLFDSERLVGKEITPFEPYVHHSLAELAGERLVENVIEHLKKSAAGVMEDAGAQNLWDEICLGRQTDSAFSEAYADHICQVLKQEAMKLPLAEQAALWLTTYNGEGALERLPTNVQLPEDIPVNVTDIAKHLLESVLYEADNYENPWIREMMGY